MDNKTLIESLEYHVSILEEQNDKKPRGLGKVAAVGAGVAGGAYAGKKIGGALGAYGSALKNVKDYNAAKNGLAAAKTTAKSAGKIAKGRGLNMLKMQNIKLKVAKAGKLGKVGGAIGGAVVGGVLAKKAYDHFKNRNK